MRIYFVYAPSYDNILREAQVRLMVSYNGVMSGLTSDIPYGFPEVMIDSGGFQLQMKTVEEHKITIGGYTRWLKLMLPKHPEVVAYMNLDIPESAEKTLNNQIWMEAEGLNPLPIWHLSDDDWYLDYYCTNYEYIAIGGLVGGGTKNIKRVIERVRHKYPSIKFHFFGVGLYSFKTFRALKPYSVDFSTWADPSRFGNQIIEDEDSIRTIKLPREVRDKIKIDRELKNRYLREAIEMLKRMETKIEDIHESYQVPMF